MSKGGAQTTPNPRFKPYPKYKDSGVEWLREIPADWSVRRLKTLISEPITDGPHETPDFLTDGVPFLSVDGIQEGELVFEGCRYISEAAHREYRRKCAPRRDDILLGKAASTGKIARVKVDFEFSVWSPLALIRLNEAEVWPSFVEYTLKSAATQAQIDVLCTSSTQKNISMRDIPILVVCLTGLQEQRAIAVFLDRETAKVDALVAKKERLIELLQEKRTALITRAVTKGLDPTVPLKDSGVEWLGKIPVHWKVKRLKNLALGPDSGIQMGPFGSMLKELVFSDTGYKLYGQENTISGDFEKGSRWLSKEQYQVFRQYWLHSGDIVVTRKGSIGNACIMPRDFEPGIIDSDTIRIRVDDDVIDSHFLALLLHEAWYVNHQIESVRRGAVLGGMNTATIGELVLAVPS
jgi:type I restriction enzyme, S subunit